MSVFIMPGDGSGGFVSVEAIGGRVSTVKAEGSLVSFSWVEGGGKTDALVGG